MCRVAVRSILGFLTRSLGCRGVAVLARSASRCRRPPAAAARSRCAQRRLRRAPPLCSAGCQAHLRLLLVRAGRAQRRPDLHQPGMLRTGADPGRGSAVRRRRLRLPFDVGPCDAAIPVYAFVDGACVQRTYGGCEGNGNRFSTLEECLATCAGDRSRAGARPIGSRGRSASPAVSRAAARRWRRSALSSATPTRAPAVCADSHLSATRASARSRSASDGRIASADLVEDLSGWLGAVGQVI